MILKEVTKLEELCTDFAQVLIDSKAKLDFKPLIKAKKFDAIFTQLFYYAHSAKSMNDKRIIDFFDFVGNKINALNKEEYVCMKDDVLNHFQKNGYSITK